MHRAWVRSPAQRKKKQKKPADASIAKGRKCEKHGGASASLAKLF
jgi:hypothetical protein